MLLAARSATVAPREYPPSTMRVFGQLAAMDCTWALISLAPGVTARSAGQLTPYTPTDTLTLERSELTSASPTAPTPGGSSRPRAKTTSASGHAADAAGIIAAVEKGIAAGAITNTVASATARLRTRGVIAIGPMNDIRITSDVRYVALVATAQARSSCRGRYP